jgi:hypothetical protein
MVIDPVGQTLFDSSISQDVSGVKARIAGTYTLVLKGAITASTDSSSNFSFRVDSQGISGANSTATALSETISDQITNAGGQKSYSFSLSAARLVTMAVQRGASTLRWTLTGPSGSIVSSRSVPYAP